MKSSHLEEVIQTATSPSQELNESVIGEQETAQTLATTLQPQQIVGNCYQVITKLKTHHSTTAYLVKERQDNEGSLLVLELIGDANVAAPQSISEKLFLQQVRLVEKLSTHVQIPKLLTHAIENQQYYVVYEYTRGEFLASMMNRRTLSESEIISLVQDVARICDFIIKTNIVNFNLSPENILKSQANHRYVLGNLKQLFDLQVAVAPLSVSQQRFLFQQQLRYLGEIVIKSVIAEERSHATATAEIPVNWYKQVTLSPRLQTILRKMIAREERDRYNSFPELAHDFQPLLKINQVVGEKYRLIRYLGARNGIETYVARNLQQKNSDSPLLIVKQFTISPKCDRQVMAAKVEKLERQVQQIQQLSIVKGLDLVREQAEDEEELYLVRNYIEGVSLTTKLNQQRLFPFQDTIELLKKALHSLDRIHQQGLIHRNIKPSNIIVLEEEKAVELVDLGILPTISEDSSNPHNCDRSRQPPEQLVGRPTISSDIYALGIVMLEILTGLSFSEFPDELWRKKDGWQEKLATHPFLIPIIERMICSDVELRYQSAGEVLQDLQQLEKANLDRRSRLAIFKPLFEKHNLPRLFVSTPITLLAIAGMTGLLGSVEMIFPMVRPQYHVYRGKQQLENQPEIALTNFERALKLQPNKITAWQGKGDALLALQKLEPALEAYNKAITIRPDKMASWRGKGNVFYRLGDFQQSLTNYERALAIEPDNITLLRRKGRILYLSSRYQEALTLQKQALETESASNIGLLSDTARSSLALGKNNEALSILIQVQNMAPTKPYLWQDKVTVLRNLNRSPEVIQNTRLILEIYDYELEQQPRNPHLWLGKAAFLRQLKRYEEAVAAYERAIAIIPQSFTALLGQSQALLGMGKYSQALDTVDRVLEIKPQSFLAWHARGLILEADKNNLEQAIASYDMAIALNQDFYPSWRDRSSVLIAQNNYPQAIVSLQKAVNLAPQDVESWSILTNALQKERKIEDAIEAIDQVIVLEPRNSQYWLQKGSLWEIKQQYTQACDIYRQGMKIAPDGKITRAMQRVGCRD